MWCNASLDVIRAAWLLWVPDAYAGAARRHHPARAARRHTIPTTCYLTGPEAVKAASHVEAAGIMQQYNDMLGADEELQAAYRQAHELYLAFRHELATRLDDSEEHIEGTSAGGMPVRVKCLHALLAQSLVMGPGANPIGDMVLERIKDEFDPALCRCSLED